MNKKHYKKSMSLNKKIVVGLISISLVFFSVLAAPNKAYALEPTFTIGSIPSLITDALKKIWDTTTNMKNKVGSKVLGSVVRNALNRFAYDAATSLATSNKGQKPVFITEDWGEYVSNLGSSAAGEYIDSLNDWGSINLCEPDIGIKGRIGLGLVHQVRPREPQCTFSKMKEGWVNEYEKFQSMSQNDFLRKFSSYFNPSSNDFGIALSLMDGLSDQILKAQQEAKTTLEAKEGWLDVRNIAGKLETVPNAAKEDLQNVKKAQFDAMGNYTGNAWVDAANVFLNQFAITLFNNTLKNLVSGLDRTSPGGDELSSLFNELQDRFNYESQGLQSGITSIQSRLRKIIRPNFNERADYDILSELSICPNIDNPGPTNCVIDDKFREAIIGHKTVGNAIEEGSLNGNWIFSNSINYNGGYSYRSMLILRKFRILPIGWEEALLRSYDDDMKGSSQKVSLMDMVSCFDPSDEYSEFSKNFDAINEGDMSWCIGLVDPNWVLKAPSNYCKKEGFGRVLNSFVADGSSEGDIELPSELIVTRYGEYCADEQSCIQENDDGSCQAYGYCNEEKRTWKFSADSCEPIYNSCKTFQGVGGSTVSFLESTLNYDSECNADNIGCERYADTGEFQSAGVSWYSSSSVYLNGKVKGCSSNEEGCHEFIRTKDGYGHNFLINSDFEDNLDIGEWDDWGTTEEEGYFSNKSLRISSDALTNMEVGPAEYNISGRTYTLSFYAKNCGPNDTFYLDGEERDLFTGTDWEYFRVSNAYPESLLLGNRINFGINTNSCLVDRIKFEKGKDGTNYSDYRDAGLIYQKLLPQYLESSCYSDPFSGNYNFKDDAPNECNNFVRKCSAKEVDCELYTSSKDGFSIPAKVSDQDYCFGECIGYDTYVQKATYLNSSKIDTFIPAQAANCSAEAVGCNAFTNLDSVEEGGEGKEYYSYLRQCVKPNSDICGDYYTWEGDNEAGYQIKVMSLKTANFEPEVTEDDSSECSKEIYNYAPTNPGYNPDCHEFYNRAGDISYHILTKTISCDSDCHPYRMAEVNVDSNISQAECIGSSMNWDSEDNVCNSCKNGGTWSDQHNSCIYQAIPGEGKTCSSDQSGCREYNGNAGNNSAIVAIYDFEFADGVSSGWYDGSDADVPLSNDSIIRNGKSLRVSSQASTVVTDIVREESSYVLKFLAKTNEASALLTAFFSNGTDVASFNLIDGSAEQISITGDGEWRIYQVNLIELDHEISFDESLTLVTNNKSISIDDIIITEIIDKYYVIQNSWDTPSVCYYDTFGKYQGPEYNLGCEQYSDRDGDLYSLRQFSELCQDSAVGCELLVDTNNFAGYEDDQFVYAVYDNQKQCGSSDLGCQLLGESNGSDNTNMFKDTYLLNNPNNYDEISCNADAVDCQSWIDSEGSMTYFKDPKDKVCEWRQGDDSQWKWYEIKVNRCDSNFDGLVSRINEVCIQDEDCATNEQCIADEEDYPCSVNRLKTIGYGGFGGLIYQPDEMTGLCSDINSGCTEYIDPVSQFSTNAIFNPNYLNLDGNESDGDGWNVDSQQVYLEPYTLYVMSSETNSSFSIENCSNIRELRSNNNFTTNFDDLSSTGNSFRFITDADRDCTVVGGGTNKSLSLRPVIVNYKLKQDIDKTTCSGRVDFSDGCVLFNERSYEGNGVVSLVYSYDAFISPDNNGGPASCITGGDCNANYIIKVEPDRVCNSWLSCTSYLKDTETGERICRNVGECNQLDSKGNCSNFIVKPQEANPFNPTLDQNITGYAKLDSNSQKRINETDPNENLYIGSYPVSRMEEVGLDVPGAHFDFEDGNPFYPNNYSTLIQEPNQEPNSGVSYPAHGKGFLKISGGNYVTSPLVTLRSTGEYFINYLFNTDRLISSSTENDAQAIITIQTESGTKIAEFKSSSAYGWSRNIESFEVEEAGKVEIILSNNGVLGSDVYFDDINIEPVLKTNNDEYIAKSCRLFPQQDSNVCRSTNENVIANGWYGYCLEKDPYNSDSCLLWYPVDSINAGTTLSDNDFGYGGKFPVNYCVELDGNFDLVEKRKVVLVEDIQDGFWKRQNNLCEPVIEVGDNNDKWFNQDDLGTLKKKFSRYIPDICGDDGYVPWVETYAKKGWDLNNDEIRFHCIPKDVLKTEGNPIKVERGCKDQTWDEGWARYNGNLKGAKGELFDEAGWGIVLGKSGSVMVYDHDEDSLYFVDASVDGEKYGLRCKKFVNTVTQDVLNRTWTNRVSEGSEFNLLSVGGANYGYVAESYSPFGASTLLKNPDAGYTSKIEFKMEGNKDDKEFAGLPFGCDTLVTDHDPCTNVGICDSSTGGALGRLCILYNGDDDFNVGSDSCGEGQCQNILNLTRTSGDDYIEILRNIFLESYGVYEWDKVAGAYVFGSERYDYSKGSDYCSGNPDDCPVPSPCSGDRDSDPDEFCAIYPKIENVSLSVNDVQIWDGTPGQKFTIFQTSWATLTFNSIIDEAQLPIREIEINWGDGFAETILNQNPQPYKLKPHTLEHSYYAPTLTDEFNISIRITDNWGFFDEHNQ